MNRVLTATLFAAVTAVASTPALAQDIGWSLSIGSNGQASVTIGNVPVFAGGPVYFPSAPPVYQPAPVYWPEPVYAPPPVVVVPRPIIIRPPVYAPPRVVYLPPRNAHWPAHAHRRFEHDRGPWGRADRHQGPHAGRPGHPQRGGRWQ